MKVDCDDPLTTRVRCYPATKLFFEMNKYDIDIRMANEGRVPLVPLVHP
jgi:hypothetical protein